MSNIHTECPCGKSHAAKFEDKPTDPVECDCGRVLRVLWRTLREGRVTGQRLTIVREPETRRQRRQRKARKRAA